MPKKKKNKQIIWIILAVLFLGIIIYGGSHNWFKGGQTFTITNQTTLNQLNNPTPNPSCSLSFDKLTIVQGESVRGTLNDGTNQQCTVYFKFDPISESIKIAIPWTVDSLVNTGPTGVYQESRTPADVGKYTIAVICGSCTTSAQTITVKKPTGVSCTDSDGDDRYTPGHVTDNSGSYYDKCLDVGNGVTEYICDSGHAAAKNWACDYDEECFTTRSGGYCRLKETSGWNVGDILFDSGSLGTDIAGGNSGLAYTVDLSGIPPTSPEGQCKLQARIQTDWGYVTPDACSGLQGSEGMKFSFYDSSGKVWERTDTQPIALGSLTKCGLSWDGTGLWSFQANKILGLPDCRIGVDYKIEIVVCGEEC